MTAPRSLPTSPKTCRLRALALASLALALGSACASTTWQSAYERARTGPSRIAEAELALIVHGDAAHAATLAEAILADPNRATPDALRAFSTLIVASDALGAIERPLLHLPGALATALAADAPDYAERFIAQAQRAWGRLDGEPAASPAVREALLSVTRKPGDRWEAARALALRELVTAERLARGPSAMTDAARAAGFLLDWRISAPWGDAPLIDISTPLGPESRPLADREATGHGFGLTAVPTTRATFSDGEVTFFDLPATGAVGFAEATLTRATAGPVTLRLESNRLVRVFITTPTGASSEVLSRLDPDAPWLITTTLPLVAGAHRVTVKLASHDGKGFFRLQLGERTSTVAERPEPPANESAADLAVGDGANAIAQLLALERRLARPLWDPRGAERQVARLEALLGPHTTLDLLAARLALGDTSAPASERRELARRRYRAVLERAPDHPVALRGLARLERDEERPAAALDLLLRAQSGAGRAAQPAHDVPMAGRPPARMETPMRPSAVSLGPAPASSGASSGTPPAPAAALRGPALPFPADPRTALELLDLFRARGWEVESLRLVESLLPLAATSPRMSQELIDTYRAFGRVPEAIRLAEQLELTFPGTGVERLGELATDRGRPTPEPLAALHRAEPQRHAALRAAIAAHRAIDTASSLTAAEELLNGFLAERPGDGWALGELARIALQRGDIAAAIARSREVLLVHPDFAPFEGLIHHLESQPEPFDALSSGPELVAAYRRFANTTEGQQDAAFPFVTVLDETRVEIRPDGSTLERSHRIRLVQTKQGADALGDLRPPNGARLLVARTLKRDGRLLEPERTEGKPDLSFPELEPGDAVETAWVTRSRVAPSEGGYLTGVSFGTYVPVHALSATFTAAAGLDLALTSFGGAPPPTRRVLADGRVEISWSISRIAPLPREPLTVSARSFFPFVDLRVVAASPTGAASDTTQAWRAIARSYASRLLRLLTPGRRAEAWLAALPPQRRTDPVLAAYAFVKSDINDFEQLNAFETPLEAALASRKGNRALVLAGLLGELARTQGPDHHAELLLCAPERDGPPEDRANPTPNANRFFYPVVLWREPSRTLHLDPSRPYTPMGDLPPELIGASCLAPMRHDTEHFFVSLPSPSISRPTFTLALDLTLDAHGDATGTLIGKAHGAAASPLRQAFIAQDDERRRIIFEQWLATLFTGARLVSLEVEDASEAERPMRFVVGLEIPGYARPDAGALVVQRLIKPLATSDFAGVPELAQLVGAQSRETPLRLLPHAEHIDIALTWPTTYTLAELPRALQLQVAGLRLDQVVSPRTSSGPPSLILSRRFSLSPGRVAPESYPSFRQAVADALFTLESPLRLERR